ncbi:MAG: aldo/keto reductase [Cyclobacteriaceae bacterium]
MQNRRIFLKTTGALVGCLACSVPAMAEEKIMKRAIPSSGEKLPVVGLGTWQSFDVGENASNIDQLKEVLTLLISKGGSVVDSSPMYGNSENIVGRLSTELDLSDKLFMATKVWTSGKQSGVDQMNRSMDLMAKRPMDLMQIHNLQDWDTHLKTMQEWKEEGIIRYTGITHYTAGNFPKMEKIMKAHPIDFIQLNYSIGDRAAEKSILPLAKEKGIAVLVNRPYQGGSLFRRTRGKELPRWAADLGINSWGQYFLKYILANEAVTCVIPGTDKPHHMLDNLGAGLGRLPSEKEQKMMVEAL